MDYLFLQVLTLSLLSLHTWGSGGTTVRGGDHEEVSLPPPPPLSPLIGFSPDKVLTVTTILIVPYASLRTHINQSTPLINSNHLYEGYIVDLLDLLAGVIGFKYRLVPVYDGSFGYKRPDGTWDGMIGEIVRQEADIAAGPMYMTEERQKTVDFSRPFMDIHASMIVRKPQHGGPADLHAPADLVNPELPHIHETYSYGTLNRGIIRKSLRTTNNTLYQRIYQNMLGFEPYAFTRTNEEGIDRVRNENYVYVLPDKIATYVTQQKPCDLTAIGSFLIEEHFGLAVHKGSTLRSYLDRAIDLLKRRGDLERLYRKWWYKDSQCPNPHSGKILSLRNVENKSGGGSGGVVNSSGGGLSMFYINRCVSITIFICEVLTLIFYNVTFL